MKQQNNQAALVSVTLLFLLISCVSVHASDVAPYLLQSGADANTLGRDGYTALHTAISWGSDSGVQALLNAGADVKIPGPRGRRPLHMASILGHGGVVKALLDAGADVNALDRSGDTPLHKAVDSDGYGVENFKVGVIAILLRGGADADAINGKGKTAFGFAIKNSKIAFAKVLALYGAGLTPKDQRGLRFSRISGFEKAKIRANQEAFRNAVGLVAPRVLVERYGMSRDTVGVTMQFVVGEQLWDVVKNKK